jgi:hypothetical protein
VRKNRGQSTIGVLVGPQVNVRYVFVHCVVVAECDSPRFILTTAESAEKIRSFHTVRSLPSIGANRTVVEVRARSRSSFRVS